MDTLALILAILGLIGLLLGVIAIPIGQRIAKHVPSKRNYAIQRVMTFIAGLILAGASFFWAERIGFPWTVDSDRGFWVGIPFFVAYFDSGGRGYVGPLTLPAAIGNSIFWFLFPHFTLCCITFVKLGKRIPNNRLNPISGSSIKLPEKD